VTRPAPMPAPALSLVLAAACWGVGTVVSKQALDEIAPVVLLLVQLAVSVTFLSLVASSGRRRPTVRGRERARAMSLGLLNPGLSYALALVGLSTIAASTSVLMWASEPALIVVLALVALHERLTPRLSMAIAMALFGVLLVVYSGGFSGSPMGVMLTFGAVLACAVYTILARIWTVDSSALAVTLDQQVAALAFAALLALSVWLVDGTGFAGPVPWDEVSAGAWTAAILSGLMYYALAFWLYLSALQRVAASIAGSFLTLVPVFGVAAALLVGERLDARQWVGAALVIGSVAVITKASTRRGAHVVGG
jgi:probable blue pigment (indigoidine) exporter